MYCPKVISVVPGRIGKWGVGNVAFRLCQNPDSESLQHGTSVRQLSLSVVIRRVPDVSKIHSASINDTEVLINGHRYPHHERYPPQSMFVRPECSDSELSISAASVIIHFLCVSIAWYQYNPSFLRGLLETRGSLLHTHGAVVSGDREVDQ